MRVLKRVLVSDILCPDSEMFTAKAGLVASTVHQHRAEGIKKASWRLQESARFGWLSKLWSLFGSLV